MSPRAKVTDVRDTHILGLPCEIRAYQTTDNALHYQGLVVDRLTKDRTLIAECDNPNTLADHLLRRGASEVAHCYDIRAWETKGGES